MATIVTMPRLSDTMEEGTVATWFKKVGDTVKEGEILAEIEEDQRKTFNDHFDFFKEMGLDYLNRKNNSSGLCLVYETLIYFLTHEEYDKCAFLRKILDEYRDYRLLNSTNYFPLIKK